MVMDAEVYRAELQQRKKAEARKRLAELEAAEARGRAAGLIEAAEQDEERARHWKKGDDVRAQHAALEADSCAAHHRIRAAAERVEGGGA